MLLAVFAPIFGDPYATPVDGLTPTGLPLGVLSSGHLLGTDSLGRDMLARVAFGARASLQIAFIANITSVGLGVIVGLVAGFYRGWVEHALMRITDVFLAVPTVISGLALASDLGTGMIGIVVVVTALYWAWTARIVFGETLALRRRTFVEAAIAMGAPGRTVIRRHILPNLASLIATHRGAQRRDRRRDRLRARLPRRRHPAADARVGEHARRGPGRDRLRAAPPARAARLRRPHGLLASC